MFWVSSFSQRGWASALSGGPYLRTVYPLFCRSHFWVFQDLKDYMRQAGEVTYADAHKQRQNEGVVEFASFSDMKNAIDNLDDTDLSGCRIKLIEDKSRRRRSRSRSRSKSHSRSHSRSKSRSHSKSRSKSRSISKSPSKARSNRSQSRKQSRSRSRSTSEDRRDRKSRSRSKSHKSRSRSRSKSSEKRMDSPIPKEEVSNSADDKND
ncbi:serine-arginine protein 55 [Trichonephila clavata]|uniref:Serine-arginine protein 55 n=1 Tax=Trichonephila clavata TaxID=2740835 RepID=A0A8X6FN83_TRICU|nr:serine-arginine protein 55 [Trichonephila clavata]